MKGDSATNPKLNIKASIVSSSLKYPSFFSIRKVVLLIFLSACIYLIISFVFPWGGFKKIELPRETKGKIQVRVIESQSKKEKEEIKSYEYYQGEIKNRRIFAAPMQTQELERPMHEEKPVVTINIAELAKDLSLLGIIFGDNPQAIIEDKKSQRTYYVSKGQFIGEFQIEDVQEKKVILNCHGQKFELYL